MNISKLLLLCAALPLCAQKVDLRTQTKSTCGIGRVLFTNTSAGAGECNSRLQWKNSTGQFGVGIIGTLNYPFHFEYGAAPTYLALDTGAMFARKHTANLAGAGNSQQVVTIQHDAHFGTGTPWSLAVFQSSKITSSAGTAGILSRITKEAESTDTSFGVHGECFNYSIHGTCVSFNAEGINLGSGSSDSLLMGFNANMGAGGGHLGTNNPVVGFRATMNHLGTNTLGYGAGLFASTGTHAYGLRIQDDDGSFLLPVQIASKKTAGSIFEMINDPAGFVAAPNIIRFKRNGGTDVASIDADLTTAADFSNGQLVFKTAESSALNTKLTLGPVGGLTIAPVTASELAFIPNNTLFFCSDCTTPSCGGGGASRLGYKNGAGTLACF